jgi:hypothetical protein
MAALVTGKVDCGFYWVRFFWSSEGVGRMIRERRFFVSV